MSLSAYDYVEPASIEEAVAILRETGDARVLSGGTALTLLVNQGLVRPEVVVGLRAATLGGDLDKIVRTVDGGLELGALVTLRAVERDPLVRSLAPALAVAAHRVASVRVRNQATIGGHLAHADPAQDLAPILLALEARVVAAGPDGRHEIALGDLAVDVFETSLGHEEVLTAVRVPPLRPASRAGSVAFRPTTREDYPTVVVAARLDLDPDSGGSPRVGSARVALGAVAATAVRSRAAEAALVGQRLDHGTIAEASAAIGDVLDPVSDGRASAGYRRRMAHLWTGRLLAMLAAGPGDEVAA